MFCFHSIASNKFSVNSILQCNELRITLFFYKFFYMNTISNFIEFVQSKKKKRNVRITETKYVYGTPIYLTYLLKCTEYFLISPISFQIANLYYI